MQFFRRLVDEQALKLEIIVNQKTHHSGEKILQLETAVGAAIKHFGEKAHGLSKTNDYLLDFLILFPRCSKIPFLTRKVMF